VAFVPPKAAYNEDALTLVPAQITKLPFVPALAGTACSVTVTVAVAFSQGEVAAWVYVYVPAPPVVGDQVPPVAGDPPKAAYNADSLTLVPAQITKVPFDPALAGAACSVTVTVAVAFAKGEVPVTVYVYVPAPPVVADQVPPAAGVPVNAAYNVDSLTLVPAQITKLPFDPAVGALYSSIFIALI
jgi:hypothetical protein